MMLFRNKSAFFLAVCTSFSLLTCPVVGQITDSGIYDFVPTSPGPPPPPGGSPPTPPPTPPPPPCQGNEVAFVMYGCPNGSGDVDRVVFRAEINEVYGEHDCIDISSPSIPSQSDLEAYDIIIVEGSFEFELQVKSWLETTGNVALVELAKAGKKVLFNAAEIKGTGATFPAGVSTNPFFRIFDTKYFGPLSSTLNDPAAVPYHTLNPLRSLPTDAIKLLKVMGFCGSNFQACGAPILAELPSSGGLLLGTVQTAFRYVNLDVKVRSNLRKNIYIQYMCAPVSPNAM